jgi:hydrogenase maturation protein HypF
VSYEGQAAVELEWLAVETDRDGAYSFQFSESQATPGAWEIDTRPLIAAVWKDVLDRIDRRVISRRFHSTLVAMIIRCCEDVRETSGLDRVVLSGGVFQNSILSSEVPLGLKNAGFQVYCQQLVPCNDGGLSLGQLAIAAALQVKG